MKTSHLILMGAMLQSAFMMGCSAQPAARTASAASVGASQGAATIEPQSTEGARPAFLTPRPDGTYVDVKGNVLVPPKVMLGLTMEQPGPALCQHLDINPARSTLLVDIIPGLPGDQAGLVDHDIVVAVDGSPNASVHDIRNKLKRMNPGDSIAFMIQRGDEKKLVKLKAVEWVAEHMVRPLTAGSFNAPGLSVDAERDEAPRELMPLVDRLNRIEQQLSEIQAELKNRKPGG